MCQFEIAKDPMARASPGVRRVAAILNFMAEHPGQAFTLTDLVKALKLSRATCHALLTGLVEVGYLYRASDKNYVLGPMLAAIGRIAEKHASPLQVAQPEMRALADELGVICSAFFRERDQIVVRDRAASFSHVGGLPLGTRVNLRPPTGAVFFARSSEADIEAALDAYVPAPTPAIRQLMHAGIGFVRNHGFSVLVINAQAASLAASGERAISEQLLDLPMSVATELRDEQDYPVAGISAPVLDTRGQVAFVMGVSGFADAMPGAEITRIGQRLRHACERVTAFNTGRAAGIEPLFLE